MKLRLGLKVIALFGLIFIAGATTSDSVGAVSAATLNANVPNAQATITGFEEGARLNNQYAVAHCGDNRNSLNQCGQAYILYIWISPRDNPTATSSTFPSTIRNVPLQLNIFHFLTAATAAKNAGTSTVGLGTINYGSNAANFVNNSTYPNDRRPASTPTINYAARSAISTKVYGAAVTSGPGSLSGSTTGYIGVSKDTNSRYWFGNKLNFDYLGPAEWTEARNVVNVRFTVRSISQYHGTLWQCIGNNGQVINTTNHDLCGVGYLDYTMTFIVTPVWVLSPKVANIPTVASVGESINPKLSVVNSGKGNSESTAWAVSAMVFDRNATVPAGETTSNNNGSGPDTPRMEKPCQHFQSLGASSCTTEQSSSSPGMARQNFDALVEEDVAGDHTLSVRDYPVGTKVCYALSIYSRDNGTIDQTLFPWGHSAPVCLIIGKKPKVQVTGGDLIVGTGSATSKNVNTASSQKAVAGVQRVFGSWVEYGIAATGTVTATASGAGYSGGGTTAFCSASLLTFSNLTGSPPSCASGTIGNYKSTKSLPNIASRLATSRSTPIVGGSFDVGAAANAAKGVYSSPERTADLTVTSSVTIGKGNWAVIYVPKAKVIIGSDIRYTNTAADPLRKASDIPQVLIIADSIDIPGGVGQIDSWLIATGEHGIINTCTDVAFDAPLTVNICNGNKLTVNGPVVSKVLYLRRTTGSELGANSGDPAEVFNLRPDAYLWATEWSSAAGRLQTVFTKELPPRF